MHSGARNATVEAAFVRISETEWKLSQQLLPKLRRRRLRDSPPYEQIVDGLLHGMALMGVAREKSRDVPGCFRAIVTLRESP